MSETLSLNDYLRISRLLINWLVKWLCYHASEFTVNIIEEKKTVLSRDLE